MYKLLIVDDEEIIRNGLQKGIQWSDMNFDTPLTAQNGEEAIEIIAREIPHVVLTDIRMPVMDGLELLKYIQKNYHGIHTVILSGYNDFEYARNGMKYGAIAYILKPTTNNEILDVFKGLQQKLEAEERDTILLSELKSTNSQYTRVEKNHFLKDLVSGNIYTLSMVKEHEAKFNLRIHYNKVCCMLFHLQSNDGDPFDGSKLNLLQKELMESLNSNRSSGGVLCEMLSLDSDSFVVILTGDDYLSLRNVNMAAGILKELLSSKGCTGFRCGIGSICQPIMEAGKSFSEAEKSMEMYYYLNNDAFCHISANTLGIPTNSQLKELSIIENKLVEALFSNNPNTIKSIINDYFAEIRRLTPEIQWLLEQCIKLFGTINKSLFEKEIILDSILKTPTINTLKKFRTLEELRYEVEDHCLQIYTNIAKSSSKNPLIDKVTKFLKANYQNKIRLEDVAAVAYMNPSYFSTFFKEKTGVNFTDYLNEIRIERAKNLLERFDYKINEISDLVGFYDTAHFCRAFKKSTDVTPLDYRKKFIFN